MYIHMHVDIYYIVSASSSIDITSTIWISPSKGLVSMVVDSPSPLSLPPFLPPSLSLYVPIVSVNSSIDITPTIRIFPSEGLISMAIDSSSPSLPSPLSELELSVELNCLACLFIRCLARLYLEPTTTLLFLRFFGVRKHSTTLLLPLASAPGGGLFFTG